MDVADCLQQHQKEPRHLGKLVGADTVGDVGSIVVGDALRFYLKLDGDRIQEARFQVFGATAQIAAASVLTDLVEGMTLDEALAVDVETLAAAVAEQAGVTNPAPHALPPMPWALEALCVAIAKYHDAPIAVDEDLPAPLVCRCYGITEDAIQEAIEDDGCKDVEAIAEATMAGRGCGTCRGDIERIRDEILEPAVPSPGPGAGAGGLGRVALMGRIQTAVHAKGIAEVELWDLEGQAVIVRLHGALAQDAETARVACERLQEHLRDEVDPTLEVRPAT